MMTPPNPNTGDITRVQDGIMVEASLWHWRAFFLVRDVSQWIREMKMAGQPWAPIGGTWDDLEDRLFARWGSATQRWPEDVEMPAFTCLVCKDTQAIVDGQWCPACHPSPGTPGATPRRKKTPHATPIRTQPPLFAEETTP